MPGRWAGNLLPTQAFVRLAVALLSHVFAITLLTDQGVENETKRQT
jgi:hypothetical protein